MSRIVAAGAVFAFVLAGIATGTGAQGLISMQKLSAPLAMPNVTHAVGGVTIMAGGAAGSV